MRPGPCLSFAVVLAGCLGASDEGGTADAGALAAFKDTPALCGGGDIDCAEGETPPDLVGAYSGQATISLSTASLWEAGESFTLEVDVVAQRPDLTLDVTVDIGGIELDGQGALVRGEGEQYSMYVKSTYGLGSDCALGILAVISGTGTSASRPETLSGRAKWVLTDPVGAGCASLDPEQQDELAALDGQGALADYEIARPDTGDAGVPDAGEGGAGGGPVSTCDCNDFVEVCDPGCDCDPDCAAGGG